MKEKLVRINTIEGYENIRDWYWLSSSDEDKIINRSTGKIIKIQFNKYGYKMTRLRTIGGKHKTCYIHMMKSRAFLFGPNPLGYNIIRHLDDCKVNNRLSNLVWGTYSQNMRDSVRNGAYNYEASAKASIKGRAKGRAKGSIIAAKKMSKPVRCIETGIIYPSAHEASRQLGIYHSNISSCCCGKCKTAKGFHFEFVDQKENEN